VTADDSAAGVDEDVEAGTSIVSHGSEAGELDLAETVEFLISQGRGLRWTTRTMNGLLHAIAKVRDVELARKLFEHYPACGVVRDQATYSILIKLFGTCSAPQMAKLTFERMKDEDGLIPNDFCNSALLHALGRTGSIDETRQAFQEMLNRGSTGTAAVNTFLRILLDRNHLEEALRVWNGMVRRGFNSDNHTVSTILHACARQRRPKLAFKLLDDAQLRELPLNDVSVSALLDVFSKSSLPSCGEKIFDHLMEQKYVPSVTELNCLIDGYVRIGKMDDANRLFHRMGTIGVAPDRITFNTLLLGFSRAQDFEKAGKTLDAMTREYKIRPDQHTYNALISACTRGARMEIAFDLFKRMIRSKVEPSLMTFNLLIDVSSRAHNSSMVEKALNLLKDHGFQPNLYTYNILIASCGRLQDPDGAFRNFREMKASGITPDQVSYHTLLRVICLAGRFDQVDSLLREMDEAGVGVTCLALNTVLRGYARHGDLEGIRVVCRKLARSGFVKDEFTFGAIIEAFIRARQPRAAFNEFRNMHLRDLKLSEDLHAWLIESLFQHGFLDEALDVFALASPRIQRRLNARHYRILLDKVASLQ